MKKIVIMGASTGIGNALAQAFLKHGFEVGVAARRTEPLRQLQQQYPGLVHYSDIDITKAEAVHKLQRIVEALGGMDIYVHVAGIGYENLSLEPEAASVPLASVTPPTANSTSAEASGCSTK